MKPKPNPVLVDATAAWSDVAVRCVLVPEGYFTDEEMNHLVTMILDREEMGDDLQAGMLRRLHEKLEPLVVRKEVSADERVDQMLEDQRLAGL